MSYLILHGWSSFMDNIERLSITLTAEQAKLVRSAVKSGEFATTSEVIRDALRGWQTRRRSGAEQIAEYRKLWKEGIESGFAEDGEVVMERLLKRFKTKAAKAKRRRSA